MVAKAPSPSMLMIFPFRLYIFFLSTGLLTSVWILPFLLHQSLFTGSWLKELSNVYARLNIIQPRAKIQTGVSTGATRLTTFPVRLSSIWSESRTRVSATVVRQHAIRRLALARFEFALETWHYCVSFTFLFPLFMVLLMFCVCGVEL